MKRKNNELRCKSIKLELQKYKQLPCITNIEKLQPFFPPIEQLFKVESLDQCQLYGIKHPKTDKEIHDKITMLINPYKWMKGNYGNLDLPMSSIKATKIHTKLQTSNNAGYVGSILSVALSTCQHFPIVYGTYTGTASEHIIDISDDYEELCDESWFSQNIGKTFDLKLNDDISNVIEYSRKARMKLQLGESIELDSFKELPTEFIEAYPAEMTPIFQSDTKDSDTESISTTELFDIESLSSYSGSLDSEDEDSEDIPFAWAIFKNVPVQITRMEKLEGTLYQLLKNSNHECHLAWIGQIIFALTYAQHTFAFTHNDLHGNNIMYIQTSKEFLYYSYEGKTYKLPTYGYLLKIIDFDRGIGSIKLEGMKESKLFMSDQFDFTEEAGGQYNCHPFYTSKIPHIKPNPSFDLTRLATALFWDIYPEGPEHPEYQNYSVFKLFIKWLTVDTNSLLFCKKNPKLDRYPGFTLYKAIAKYAKNAIPHKEISSLDCFLGECPLDEIPLIIE